LNTYRVDVYYNEEKSSYKNLGIKYNDLIFKNRRYVIDKNKYKNIKKELRIDDKYEFLFSLHKNDIVGIANKDNPKMERRYRFSSFVSSDNPNRIELKPINKNEFKTRYRPTIGTKTLKFNKYHTDILGNVFNVDKERLKLKFELDN